MDAALKQLRENFRDRQHRAENLIFMHTQVRRDSPDFPKEAIATLDALVLKELERDYNSGLRPRNSIPYVVLDGEYSCEIGPNATYDSGYGMVSRYQFYFLGKDIHLGTFQVSEIKNKMMQITAKVVNSREIYLEYFLEGIGKMEHVAEFKSQIECKLIRKGKLDCVRGVTIKRANKTGRVTIADSEISLGTDYANSYVFVFFDRGRIHFFDNEGYGITPSSEPLIKYCRTKRRNRISRLSAAYDEYNPEQNTRSARNQIIKRWKASPEHFRKGWHILLSGHKHGKLDCRGWFGLVHYLFEIDEDSKRSDTIEGRIQKESVFFVDMQKPHAKATLYWKGPYVLIKDEDGKTLNAHELPNYGLETTGSHYMEGLEEAIGISNLTSVDIPRITINSHIYSFSAVEIKELLKRFPENIQKALYAHVHFNTAKTAGEDSAGSVTTTAAKTAEASSTATTSKRADYTDEFRLLVNYNRELFSFPINCIRSYEKRKL